MELDLNRVLLLSVLSILALSFPCRAATGSPGANLSTATSVPCDVGMAGCRIADLQPELEAIADPGLLGASLPVAPSRALDRTKFGCGRPFPTKKYTPCPPKRNGQVQCDVHCRTTCPC
ncbi:hypothetical protein BT93_I0776 [Corymbia citriodora subsp. variegata]|nr:hypothetical protein BT93_I0776 [Corymbia citriodora subsp. variegata]